MPEISSISPVLQSYIQQTTSQTSTQTPQLPIKKLSKDFIKNHKKEVLISTVGALALSALVIGGIMYGKKTGAERILRKSEQILSESENIFQKSQSLAQSAKGKYQEVLSLIQQGKTTNFEDVLDESGNIIRKFELKEDTSEIAKMLEYKNGILSRQTQISSTLKPELIEEFIEGTNKSNQYFFDELGIAEQIQLGNLKTQNSEFSKETLNLKNGKFSIYAKDCSVDIDKNAKTGEVFVFEDNKLKGYVIDGSQDSNGNVKSKEMFEFEDNKLSGYCKDYSQDSDGNIKIKKELTFEDGKIVEREKNTQYGAEDKFDNSDDYIEFDDSDFIDDND